jgi:hypothetical protein
VIRTFVIFAMFRVISLLQKSLIVMVALCLFPKVLPAGTLSGTFQSIPTGSNVNLTAIGKLDWVHWGLYTETSIDRKASVSPQISNFTLLGDTNDFLAAYQYSGNSNSYSWYDSSFVTVVTNTTTGVWAYGNPVVLGSGFQLQVSADTQSRTLQVFVGAFAAEGRLTASLSDASASGFTNQAIATVNNLGNGPSGVFTLNYSADSPGQVLTITWTVALARSPSGNVTLQAAALTATNADNPPYISITNLTNGAAFPAPATISLQATGQDFDGSITNVAFFANTSKLGEITTSPYNFTWNNAPTGHYLLTAHATDNAGVTSTSAPVEIFVYGTGGNQTSSVASSPPAVDLTAEGSADWAHWGLATNTSFDVKSGVPRQISNFTQLGTNAIQNYSDNATAFSWSDGTPTSATNATTTGIFVTGEANGFLLTVPADTQARQLRVYVGGYGVQGDFQTYLSDLSAAPYSDTSVSNAFGNSYVVYTINYSAASAGQQLVVIYRSLNLFDSVYGNVTLQAATLQGGTSAALPVYITNPSFLGGSFALSFLTQSNHNYLVEYTDVLPPTNWVTLTNLPGTASTISVTNQNVTATQRFYRVLTQ